MNDHEHGVSRLEPRDVGAALRLSTQAGWNQLEADWLRLVSLWPDACFAVRDDERSVIATSTLASFGGVGWVGMVLVDESLRGRGIGGAVLRAAVAAGASLDAIGLDATDSGMPVYAKHGFAPQVGINRWGGSVTRPCQNSARPAIDEDWPAILELDRRACGVNRSPGSGLYLAIRRNLRRRWERDKEEGIADPPPAHASSPAPSAWASSRATTA